MADYDLRLIAAVGRRGQLGLDGRLPWRDKGDLAFFRNVTMWNPVIMGKRTADAVGPLQGRHVLIWDGRTEPKAFLDSLDKTTWPYWARPGKTIWLAGGAHTYAAFMPLVTRSIVTRIDYDGPADAWMPPLWQPVTAVKKTMLVKTLDVCCGDEVVGEGRVTSRSVRWTDNAVAVTLRFGEKGTKIGRASCRERV